MSTFSRRKLTALSAFLACTSAMHGAACVGDDPTAPAASSSSGEPNSSSDGGSSSGSIVNPPPSSSSGGSSSSGSSGVADVAAQFSPADLPRLVLWLDAASQVAVEGGKVTEWKDLSPSGLTLRPPTVARRPSAAVDGEGRAAVAFADNVALDSSPEALLDASSETPLDFATESFLVELVLTAQDNERPYNAFMVKSEQPGPHRGLQMFAHSSGKPVAGLDGYSNLFTAPSGNLYDGAVHIFGFERKGTSLAIRLDGQEIATQAIEASHSASTATSFRLGTDLNGNSQGKSKIYAVVMHRGSLPDEDRGRLETYLRDRYQQP